MRNLALSDNSEYFFLLPQTKIMTFLSNNSLENKIKVTKKQANPVKITFLCMFINEHVKVSNDAACVIYIRYCYIYIRPRETNTGLLSTNYYAFFTAFTEIIYNYGVYSWQKVTFIKYSLKRKNITRC